MWVCSILTKGQRVQIYAGSFKVTQQNALTYGVTIECLTHQKSVNRGLVYGVVA